MQEASFKLFGIWLPKMPMLQCSGEASDTARVTSGGEARRQLAAPVMADANRRIDLAAPLVSVRRHGGGAPARRRRGRMARGPVIPRASAPGARRWCTPRRGTRSPRATPWRWSPSPRRCGSGIRRRGSPTRSPWRTAASP